MNNSEKQCPCFSGKFYKDCCKPLHDGVALPDDALALMRSRFSAFALNIPDYILTTTHPASPHFADNKYSWRYSIVKFCKNTIFQGLEVIDFKERENQAAVTFTAIISQQGEDATFTEKSIFEKRGDRWLYVRGLLEEGRAPNLITRDSLRILPIAYYGDPILRKKTQSIPAITDDLKKLIEEMVETMDAYHGIGLAAPQVHHSIRLFIIRKPTEEGEDVKGDELGELKVFINPNLIESSEKIWKAPEACISIPTLRGKVERSKEITVEYMNIDGEVTREKFKDWEARVIQHEYDHIEGILYIDRLSAQEQQALSSSLKNIEHRIHEGRVF